MSESSGFWPTFLKFSAACLRATASGALAWLFWQAGALPGFEACLFLAAIFGLVAVKHTIIAVIEIVRLIRRDLNWARFRRQGAAPKADRMASDAELRKRGLIR